MPPPVVAPARAEVVAPPPAAAKSAPAPAPTPDPDFDLPQLQHEPRRPQPSMSLPLPIVAQVPADEKKPWPRYAVAAVVLVALTAGGLMAVRRRASATGMATDTGTLTVNSNPAGAQLLVDGKLAGTTPTTLTLPQGAHELTLRGAGTEPRSMSVNVSAGTQVSQYIELPKAEARLENASGKLQVRTDPAGALVTVDGIPRGASPVTIGSLTPGDHRVVVSANGNSVEQSVTVDAGMTSALVVPLRAATDKAAVSSGWIAISSPVDVQLFEGGKLLGSSQSDRIMVVSGAHQIDMVNEALGYRATRSISVTPGKVETVTVKLPMGSMAINAIPWAEVWVDGEKAGDTPIGNHPVTIGKHEVTFRHPDLGEAHQTVTVTMSGPARISMDLRKK
jgi:PEGA domain-containing protein